MYKSRRGASRSHQLQVLARHVLALQETVQQPHRQEERLRQELQQQRGLALGWVGVWCGWGGGNGGRGAAAALHVVCGDEEGISSSRKEREQLGAWVEAAAPELGAQPRAAEVQQDWPVGAAGPQGNIWTAAV